MAVETNMDVEANACGVLKFVCVDGEEWHFQSRQSPEKFHTVHLADWSFSGACSCEHFDFRIRPALFRNEIKPHSAKAKCRHIRRAEQILLLRIKRKLFSKFTPETRTNERL
jgi:hypothetical protein